MQAYYSVQLRDSILIYSPAKRVHKDTRPCCIDAGAGSAVPVACRG